MRTFTLAVAALFIPVCLTAAEETFSGVVLSPDGQAAAGVTIRVRRSPADTGWVPASTDEAGRFSLSTFTIGIPSVLAITANNAMAFGRAYPRAPLTLQIAANSETRGGVLVLPSGRPAAGADVELSAIEAEVRQYETQMGAFILTDRRIRTTTDQEGAFSFAGIPPGLIATVRVAVPGCGSLFTRIADAKPLTMQLSPEATVSGKVLANGVPVQGHPVFVTYDDHLPTEYPATVKTAADGSYTIHGLAPGRVTVTPLRMGNMGNYRQQSLTLKAGEKVTGVDLAFTPGVLIRGMATDEKTGAPLKDVQIAAVQEGRSKGSATTGADGTYELRVPPGAYQLTAHSHLLGPAQRMPETFTWTEGDVIENKDFVFRLPRQISVQALLPDGKPAAGATVWFRNPSWTPDLTADAQGRVKLSVASVPSSFPMTGLLIVTLPNKSLAALAGFADVQTIPDSLTISLAPAATATVQITDEQKQPQPGYGFTIGYYVEQKDVGSITNSGTVTSDERGCINFACLPPGVKTYLSPTARLRDVTVNPKWPDEPFVFKPGERRELPPIAIVPSGRSLQVFVGNGDGKPVEGAAVLVGNQPPVVSDDKGKVTLTKLPLHGKVTLFAFHPTERLLALQTIDPAGDYWPGLLLKPLGKATGQLLAKGSGRPLQDHVVQLLPRLPDFGNLEPSLRERVYSPSSSRNLTTDADGCWHAADILPGAEYQVSALVRGVTYFVGTFTATGGEGEQNAGVFELSLPDDQ